MVHLTHEKKPTMTTYAAKTDVTSDRSRQEIERTLSRYGADEFAYMTKRGVAVIAFVMHDRQVRFTLPLPDPASGDFTRTPTGKLATESAAQTKYEQAVRQKWRALALVIKAKLEAIESEISTFEHEFGMSIVLPDGRTAADHITPWITQSYELGATSTLLAIEGK